jgi:hypothetical protein
MKDTINLRNEAFVISILSKDFLIDYLIHYRKEKGSQASLVDSCLANLFALRYRRMELLELIDKKNCCIINECAPILTQTGELYALSVLYRQNGKSKESLEILWRHRSI